MADTGEKKRDLTVVVPFCNEFPANIFTTQSFINSLEGSGIDYEIILVDNMSARRTTLKEQHRGEIAEIIKKNVIMMTQGAVDEAVVNVGELLNNLDNYVAKKLESGELGDGTQLFFCKEDKDRRDYTDRAGRVRYIQFDDVQSHWQAKNKAMSVAQGEVFFISDAHCMVQGDLLARMYKYYRANEHYLNGSLHAHYSFVLNYPPHKPLVYKLFYNENTGTFHYSFTPVKGNPEEVYRIPVMITNGCMISRKILLDKLGGFPPALGIWGGGENWLNFAMAVTGHYCNIYPYGVFQHLGWKRGYCWNQTNLLQNRAVAMYACGGMDWLNAHVNALREKEPREKCDALMEYVPVIADNSRKIIEKHQVKTPTEWAKEWQFNAHVAEMVFKGE